MDLPSADKKPFKLFLIPSTKIATASSYSFAVRPEEPSNILSKLLLPAVRFNIASLYSLPGVFNALVSSTKPFAGSLDNSIDATFLEIISVRSKLITLH